MEPKFFVRYFNGTCTEDFPISAETILNAIDALIDVRDCKNVVNLDTAQVSAIDKAIRELDKASDMAYLVSLASH